MYKRKDKELINKKCPFCGKITESPLIRDDIGNYIECSHCNNIIDLKNNSTTEILIEEVEKLNANTPNGVIVDSDTILVDLIENCDHEFSGISQDIFNIWKQSSDKKSVEQMFYEFTDMEFVEYLEKCKVEITT